MSYESPIRIMDNSYESVSDAISKHFAEGVDNLIVEAVVNVGVHVDKDELEKALRYDRDQYVKGYADGKRDAAAAIEALQAEVEELKAKKMKLAENSLRFVGKVRELDKRRLEPKRGEWIEENRRPRSSQFVCSECHRTAYDPQPTRDKAWRKRCRYAYCPNCGAKMEVQDGKN